MRIKKLKGNKKGKVVSALKIFALTKIPILIYLAVFLSVVPSIDAVEQKKVLGAHRGDSINHTENTLESFQAALEKPEYEFVEFDINYSKDGKILVLHQNNMLGIPKKGINMSELTYGEIQEKFEFYIPQYHEVMSLIGNKKPVQIEIKSSGNQEKNEQLADFVIRDCENRGILHQVLIASPNEEIIRHIEENYPEIKTGRVYWLVFCSVAKSENT